MRTLALMRRNTKEMLRDPLTLGFGLGFPLILLALMSLIAKNAPVEVFRIEKLAPGVIAFGFTFLALFSALLIAKDRGGALMLRLLNSPLTAGDFIAGYALPLLPMAAAQGLICMGFAAALGLEISWRMLACLAALAPAAALYIALGLIFGSILTDRQVGGVCGALLTNVTAWLSGIWFDLELVGGGFAKAARLLPFANAVDAARYVLAGDVGAATGPLLIVIGYAAGLTALAVWVFSKRMHSP